MPKAYDRVGLVYGKLTVIRLAGRNKHKQKVWECLCECGNTSVAVGGALTTGHIKSCGCSEGYRIHGGAGKGSYNTWRAMMRRCYNPKDKDFKKYGALGVTVQDSWRDYPAFAADMGEPEGTMTLHRVDPYGNYTKENCEWATPTRQAREVRVSRRSKTGHQGIVIRNGKFSAQITAKKKKYYAPSRNTLEEAIADRKALEATYWI